MNKYNIKIFGKAGRILPSIALASTFAVAMPVIANAEELGEETPITLEALSTPTEVKTDTEVSFSGTYDTKEEAEAVQKAKEKEYKAEGYENIQSEITPVKGETTEEYESETYYATEEEAKKALDDFAAEKGGTVTDYTIVENTDETLYEETTEIISGTVDDYVKSLKDKVAELNETGEYRLVVSDPKTITSDKVTIVTTTTNEPTQIFGTLAEANDYIASLGESTELRIVETTITELEKTITNDLKETFSTEAAAQAYIEELESQGYTVSAEIKEVIESGIILNETYDTKEAADKALAEFLANYTTTNSSSIEKVRDESEDKSSTVEGTEEYASEEAAKEAASELAKETEEYKITVSIRPGIKKIEGATEYPSTEQFDTYAAALAYIEDLKAQGYDVNNLEIELVSYEESIWKDEDGVIVDPGASDDKSFTYNHFDITLLTQFTKIDAEGNETTVNGTIAINDVKINDNDVKMTGPKKDPNTHLMEYESTNRHNLNVTDKSLVEISGNVKYDDTTLPFEIQGYLSEAQNVCGGQGGSKGYDLEFESVTIVNNKVLIDTNIINKYKVTGTMTKTETTDVWYVDTTTTTKGYDYKVNAKAEKVSGYEVVGKASIDVIDKYKVDASITTTKQVIEQLEQTEMSYKIFETTYTGEYTVEGTISIPDDDYSLKITGDKEKEKNPDLEPEPEPEPEPQPEPEPTPDPEPEPEPEPQPEPTPDPEPEPTPDEPVKTGDEMPNPAPGLALLGLGLGAIARGKQKTLGKYPKRH